MFEKILVPVDGSKASDLSLQKALEIGEKFGSELFIFTVVPELTVFEQYPVDYPYTQEVTRANQEQARYMLEELSNNANYSGELNTYYRSGSPATEIVQFAEENDIDLIVIGNRGLGAFSRTLLGSVSNKVINHSSTSVLVVKGEQKED